MENHRICQNLNELDVDPTYKPNLCFKYIYIISG